MVGIYSASIKGSVHGSTSRWVITGVYGPTNSDFLAELEGGRNAWNNRYIGGDFNEFRNPKDRSGGGRFSISMRNFFDFIDRMRLRELPLAGPTFTWSNFQNYPSMSKLDKFLLSPEWDKAFPVSKGEILA